MLKQTRRIIEISGDGAYNTRYRHGAIRIKRAVTIIPLREGASFWERGHPRKKRYGTNKKWKKRYGYHTSVHSQKRQCIV